MEGNVLILSEFLEKVDATRAEIQEWDKYGLIQPVGHSAEKGPLYDAHSIASCRQIKKLLEVGYGIDEIQKIIKKVGLPKSETKPASKKTEEFLTVGTLADRVGVSARTIKHWEDKGIISPDMRSEGGFRLYSGVYIEACKRIKDLQTIGFSLEEIKEISNSLRDFLLLQDQYKKMDAQKVHRSLETMSGEVNALFEKIKMLKTAIHRWDELLRKKKKEITVLTAQNRKRMERKEGDKDA
jgi:DNA-binding transcriptional MerR regulator